MSTTSGFTIKTAPFTKQDWIAVSQIYKEGIATGIATFETQIPTWNDWNALHIKTCRIKAFNDNTIIGWTALSPTSKRNTYKGVAEISIYISTKHRNLGIGKILLEKLINESEKAGFWSLQASIFSDNKASIALHKSLGFREIGYREKIGKLNNIWYDNTILERRSEIII
ncbi:N-acetyltransferase family protein [Aquimarina muelleri]|uniref:GNAT family N-acetyltransferase n=1 Tax=Aquimarina muelleri TaxID=279356 RepID=UPI003F68612C